MKNGFQIIKFLQANANLITHIHVNGDPKDGFIEFTLKDETKKQFDWDEEDQALFQCAMEGKEWKPGMKGLTSLTIRSNTSSLAVITDKPVPIMINQQPLNQWGTKVGTTNSLWRKRETAEQRNTNANSNNTSVSNSKGLAKGWFNKM